MTEKTFLFNEFSEVSAKEWKQKIQFDLKGLDYNQTLLTQTNEGITIKPFYHSDLYKKLDVPKPKQDSKICQTIYIASEKIANAIAQDALKKGVQSIRFIADKKFDYTLLLNNLPKKTSFIFEINFLNNSFLKELIDFLKQKNASIFIDVIGNFARFGNWFLNEKDDFSILNKILRESDNKISILGIDASLYQNAGATIIQQIAYSLAHFLSYADKNILPKKIFFKFSLGSNYFFEISKLRAFRYLFDKITSELNLKIEAEILAIPSKRNKSIYDYNVNMLRTTTEYMSALLGGAETICSMPYDVLYHKSNEFGERIARNQLLILKEESYFTEAYKMVNGSYYVEHITFEMAEKSLELLKNIDKNGGFLEQLKKGTIQRKIEESANKEQEQFDKGELVLLGTNKYPNEKDKMKNELELYPFVKRNPRKTEIKPIIEKRLAEKLELERLKKEE